MHPVFEQFLRTPFVAYTPQEIKRIRMALGKSPAEFAYLFKLDESTIKAWETPEGKPKHRAPNPTACLFLVWCAHEANTRPSCINNQIRTAAMAWQRPVRER